MNIGLINCDARYNLALQKLNRYYTERGDNVVYVDADLNYYKDNEERYYWIFDFDKVYVSAIFDNSISKLHLIGNHGQVDYGGIGSQYINKTLPDEIDRLEPYDIGDIYYNFITRGCIRHCYFCKVFPAEGRIRLNKHPSEMLLSKDNHFFDNNILAYEDHLSIIQWLNDHGIKYHFNQGLDFRLTNDANLSLLADSRYSNEYLFAFDSITYKPMVERKLPLIQQYIYKPFKTKWYCYVNINDELDDLTYRVKWLKEHKCLPYITRDRNTFEDSVKSRYISDIASYCNQPWMFKTKDFPEFLHIRTKNQERIEIETEIWERVKL